jgi:general secretion pathway protein F
MRYQIKALEATGGVVSVDLDAADADDAARQARAGGLQVISLKAGSRWKTRRTRTGKRFSLALFNQDLLALLEAGLTLLESIETIAEKQASGPTHRILAQLAERVRQGRTLSQAMEEQPAAFPPLYVATVRASERSGGLSDSLRRYAAYESQLDVVRRKVVSASIYPMLLMVAGMLVMIFLLGYVIPKFSLVYEDMHSSLPLGSRVLLASGGLVRDYGLHLLAVLVVGSVLAVRAARSPAVRRRVALRLWRVPGIGERMKLYHLARFYRTLGMLLRGGTPIVPALDMAGGLLSTLLQPNVVRAREAIREGQAISQAMTAAGLTTPVARRMLRVGERSGRMDEMMDRIAVFIDEEIARWVDWFTRLFEPLLMAFIGIIIGAIVVLMYLPIFELAGSIG